MAKSKSRPGGKPTVILVVVPFLLVVGGGAVGYLLGDWIGAAVGAGAGLVILGVAFRIFSAAGKEMPGCRCGESKHEELEYKRSKKWGFVYRCDKCRRSYMLINEVAWDEIMDDGSRVPYKARGAFGAWHDAVPGAS